MQFGGHLLVLSGARTKEVCAAFSSINVTLAIEAFELLDPIFLKVCLVDKDVM